MSRKPDLSITFLGTSSGGGPTESRNCSSLVLDLDLAGHDLWMVDCAEGTTRQFQLQPSGGRRLKVNKLGKIFITHMHADHVMGILPLLRNILHPPIPDVDPSGPPLVELYGPAGLRTFVRSTFQMTYTRTADRYVVHELLSPGDVPTPCDAEVLHPSEFTGRDIMADSDGFWRGVTGVIPQHHTGQVTVDAGPIEHRVPCVGYIFRETDHPSRKLVILGDTSDPSRILPLCSSPSILVHEATDSYISPRVDPKAKRAEHDIKQKTVARGHSTSDMAGAFARRIGAGMLVLNHIGGRFPAPVFRGPPSLRARMAEVERIASEAWGMGKAVAAVDFMRVMVPHPVCLGEEGEGRASPEENGGDDLRDGAGPGGWKRPAQGGESSPGTKKRSHDET